jgi:hypothetical protein
MLEVAYASGANKGECAAGGVLLAGGTACSQVIYLHNAAGQVSAKQVNVLQYRVARACNAMHSGRGINHDWPSSFAAGSQPCISKQRKMPPAHDHDQPAHLGRGWGWLAWVRWGSAMDVVMGLVHP